MFVLKLTDKRLSQMESGTGACCDSKTKMRIRPQYRATARLPLEASTADRTPALGFSSSCLDHTTRTQLGHRSKSRNAYRRSQVQPDTFRLIVASARGRLSSSCFLLYVVELGSTDDSVASLFRRPRRTSDRTPCSPHPPAQDRADRLRACSASPGTDVAVVGTRYRNAVMARWSC